MILVLINAAAQKHAQKLAQDRWRHRFYRVLIVVWGISEIPRTDGLKLMDQANKLLHNVLGDGMEGPIHMVRSQQLPFSCWWWIIWTELFKKNKGMEIDDWTPLVLLFSCFSVRLIVGTCCGIRLLICWQRVKEDVPDHFVPLTGSVNPFLSSLICPVEGSTLAAWMQPKPFFSSFPGPKCFGARRSWESMTSKWSR